jgi:hypothetical protein
MRITFFGCLKPFRGAADIAQRNAIASWRRLEPAPEILLFGGDDETPAVCAELGATYVPGAARNAWGTVVLGDLFAAAQRLSSADLFCYINADIVLMADFMRAVSLAAARRRRFLLIGQRWDLDVAAPIAFAQEHWEADLRARAHANGQLHPSWGIDYFVFTRGLLDPVPPFAVGRPSFDNWFVYRARSRWAPVIDATPAVLAIHQNHDYSFHPDGRYGIRESEEARHNLTLAGGQEHIFWTDDRTHVLSPDGLRLDLAATRLRQHWRRLPVLTPPAVGLPVRWLQQGLQALRG